MCKMSHHDSVTPASLRKFHVFGKLPSEFQIQIRELAVVDLFPRIVEIVAYNAGEYYYDPEFLTIRPVGPRFMQIPDYHARGEVYTSCHN